MAAGRSLSQVSVIIPVFNGEATIGVAVESALRQEGCDVEVIVVDDGSTDCTKDALCPFASSIRLISQENCGAGCARNAALALAKGEYVAFLDADDSWLPGKLAKQINAITESAEADVVYTGARYVGATGPSRVYRSVYVEGDVLDRLLEGNFIATSSVLAKKSCFVDPAFRFPSNMRLGEDYATWVRLALAHRFAVVREELVLYRTNNGAAKYTGDEREELYRQIEAILRQSNLNGRLLRKYVGRVRSSAHWSIAVLAAQHREWGTLLARAIKGFAANPFSTRGLLHLIKHGLIGE